MLLLILLSVQTYLALAQNRCAKLSLVEISDVIILFISLSFSLQTYWCLTQNRCAKIIP